MSDLITSLSIVMIAAATITNAASIRGMSKRITYVETRGYRLPPKARIGEVSQ